MSENNLNPTPIVEDISSTSPQLPTKENPIVAYADGIYKNLANVIKLIAFVLGIAIILLSLVAAFLIVSKTAFSIVLALATIIIGTILAAIAFFPIFGIGHILCQNNEILKKLNK